jgi:ATP-binding cassette subfamily B protein
MLPKTLPAFLWHFISPYRFPFIGMMISVLILAVLTSLTPYLMKVIIDDVVEYKGASGQLFSAVFIPAILFILMYQAMDFCWALYDYFKLKTLPKVREDIINKMFCYLQGHSYSYFQKNFSGSISNKVSDMARGAESVISQSIEPLFSQLTALTVAIISMYMINPLSSLVLLIWSVIFLVIVYLFYKKTLVLSEDFSESHSISMGKLVDSITNIINVKLFARGRFEGEYLAKYTKHARIQDQDLQLHMFKVKILQGTSVTLLFGCMVGVLIYARERNLVTVGDFAFILSLSMTTMQGLWYLASHFLTFSQELGLCKQALSIVNVPHEIRDAPNAPKLLVTQGKICFDNVSFNYERNKNVFRNKSLTIEGGQKIGLVGFSGSGKTTFSSLILRFFNVNEGRVLIDEQNIAEVTQDSLHENIALIPQDPMLFHRSLMENIRYGRLNATDAEVIEASKKAHCHEFIELQPEKYNTLVGERGLKISGGQRQRIAIARAILKNAPILILDEATSALDSITEAQIRESLEYLMQGRTTIVIAHRLSTLSDMNRILVFMGGQVVEDGSHEELMDQPSHYAKLWAMQAGGFLPDQATEE